jgi:hypothetical protein
MALWLVNLLFIDKVGAEQLAPISFISRPFCVQKLIVKLIYFRISCHQFKSKYQQTPIFELCQEPPRY